jgi:hypothetical protein
MKLFYILILTLAINNISWAQQDGKNIFNKLNDETYGGDVRIYQTPALRLSMEKHLASVSEQKGINGYRIQIYFGNGKHARDVSNKTRVEFISKNKNIKAYIQYENPYFKVRVGDFRNKTEALNILEKIKSDYPDAFIVPDVINIAE